MKTALLLIDIQNVLVESNPYDIDKCLEIWPEALRRARMQGLDVIFVRHNDEEFIKDTHGWQIHDRIHPQEQEIIIDKHFNSAFKETNLDQVLQERQIEHLIIAGMSTNYCVDTTIKVAFEKGYQLSVIEAGTATFDAPNISAEQLIEHYETIWANCFAEVDFLDQILPK